MVDEAVTQTEPVVTEPVVQPVPDVSDPSGVPWRNRASEYERKFAESQAMVDAYQRQLGQLIAQQQTVRQPETSGTQQDARFDELTTKFVTETAQREAQKIAYSLINRAQLNNEISSSPELNTLAQQEFSVIVNNPLYATWNQEAKEALAVANAKFKLSEKNLEAFKRGGASQALQQANQAQASVSNLPGTGHNLQPALTDKDLQIKKWMDSPDNQLMVRRFHGVDPASEAGKKKLREVAEYAVSGGI